MKVGEFVGVLVKDEGVERRGVWGRNGWWRWKRYEGVSVVGALEHLR